MEKKTLTSYIKLLEKENLTVRLLIESACGEATEKANKEPLSKKISGLYADSRKSKADGIFFCKGRHFLREYLCEALQKGVAAVVYESGECPTVSDFEKETFFSKLGAKKASAHKKSCVFIEVKNIRKAMAMLAAFHYDYPMSKAVTVAVTGTKGKTGTVKSISGALNENPKFKAIILNDALPDGSPHLTTPEPIELHAAAARCVEHKATHIVCEISSQGVKTLRTYGIIFDLACFLNFGADHISPSEHPTLDDYFRSKAALFSCCKRAVINLDCERATEIMRIASESKHISANPVTGKKEIFTFSFVSDNATFSAEITEESENGSLIEITEKADRTDIAAKNKSAEYTDIPKKNKSAECTDIPENKENASCTYIAAKNGKEYLGNKKYPLYVSTVGLFNAQNALAAYSACRILGCAPEEVFRGALFSKPKGRMEIFDTVDGKVRVIVDYAHNKMSFEALFDAAKQMYGCTPPKITAIFGCSGEKAYGRRYELPEVALKHADRIIICEDDSGREPFESIKKDILSNIKTILLKSGNGYEKTAKISVIKNRERAIGEAVKNAQENGERRLILFTGKGRENTMTRKNGEVPTIDDVSATLKAIKSYNSRLSLDTLFSKLSDKAGELITASFENHEDIIENFAVSAFRLLQAGITLVAVCGEKSMESLKESCYKNGTVCYFIDYKAFSVSDTSEAENSSVSSSVKSTVLSSAQRGALTVITVKGDVQKAAAEISVREKSDTLVYLTRSGGIILSGRPSPSALSEKAASAISEKIDSGYLKLALTAIRGGVKSVAVIDGREKNSLAFYGTGNGYSGTVIKKD